MELVACPSCGAFSNTEAVCSECGVAIPDEPVAVASIPTSAPAADPEPVPEAPPTPAAFEAAPEVLARIDDLEAQIAKKPQAPALYLQLSKVYAEAGRMDLATAAVERFLAVDPGNAYMRHKLAQLTGTPEAVRASPAPAAARTASGTTTVSFQAAMAQRPSAPTLPRRAPS